MRQHLSRTIHALLYRFGLRQGYIFLVPALCDMCATSLMWATSSDRPLLSSCHLIILLLSSCHHVIWSSSSCHHIIWLSSFCHLVLPSSSFPVILLSSSSPPVSRYVGLTWTSASHFQIFRGSLIIFTGLLTVRVSSRLQYFLSRFPQLTMSARLFGCGSHWSGSNGWEW